MLESRFERGRGGRGRKNTRKRKKKWLFGILFDVAAALTAAERSGSLDELHKNW